MKIYTNKTEFNIKNSVVALGKFDGLHLGHKKLLEAVLNTSEKEGYTSVLFSFDTSIISESKQVNTFEERIHICENMNPDYYIYYPVSKETMEMRAKDFIENVLIKELGVKKVVTGKDFLFGRKREGNTETLKKYADEEFFEYEIIDDVYIGGLKVSTSMIKKSLSWGEIYEANRMLGYEYYIMGNIVKGKQIGRLMNLRTINVEPDENKFLPKNGVYKTSVIIDGKKYHSITNIGFNPTVTDGNNGKIKVETHILNFDENVYDKEVIISFERFIREEKKFSSFEELKTQILLDISRAYL